MSLPGPTAGTVSGTSQPPQRCKWHRTSAGENPRAAVPALLAAQKAPWRTPQQPLAAPELSIHSQSELLRKEPNSEQRSSVNPSPALLPGMEDMGQQREPRAFPESVTRAVWPGSVPAHTFACGHRNRSRRRRCCQPMGAVGHLHL